MNKPRRSCEEILRDRKMRGIAQDDIPASSQKRGAKWKTSGTIR